MKSVLDIRSGSLFPWQFQFIAVGLILGAVGVLQSNIWLSLVLLIAGILILTAYDGVEFDTSEKKFRQYNSFLFIKTGKIERYDEIEKLFINKSRDSQRVFTAYTNHAAVFRNEKFNAYLKFSNGEKIHLFSKKDKDAVLVKLGSVSQALGIGITDHA